MRIFILYIHKILQFFFGGGSAVNGGSRAERFPEFADKVRRRRVVQCFSHLFDGLVGAGYEIVRRLFQAQRILVCDGRMPRGGFEKRKKPRFAEMAQPCEFFDRQFFRAIFGDIIDGGLDSLVHNPLFAIKSRQYFADKTVKAGCARSRTALVR